MKSLVIESLQTRCSKPCSSFSFTIHTRPSDDFPLAIRGIAQRAGFAMDAALDATYIRPIQITGEGKQSGNMCYTRSASARGPFSKTVNDEYIRHFLASFDGLLVELLNPFDRRPRLGNLNNNVGATIRSFGLLIRG